MGEVIRKSATNEDIVADVRRTLTNAQAKGGRWKEAAEAELGPVLALIDGVQGQLAAAQRALAPLSAAAQGRREEANAVLGRVSDDVWNDVGRPRSDAALALLFPNGVASYTDGDLEEQPDRMALLAQLLETTGHPRLAPDTAKAQAQRVRAAAEALRAAVGPAASASAQLDVLQRVRRAVVVSAQATLMSLKRVYKNAGFTEVDIHAVIPDRPVHGRRTPPQPSASPDPSSPPKALEATRG
jgi:hypothetical protein